MSSTNKSRMGCANPPNNMENMLQWKSFICINHMQTSKAKNSNMSCSLKPIKQTNTKIVSLLFKLNKQTRWCQSKKTVLRKGFTTTATIILMFVLLLRAATATTTMTTYTNSAKTQYSRPLNAAATSAADDGGFRPMVPTNIKPEYISRNIFTETGQYRVFQPIESDLRAATTIANRQRRQQVNPKHTNLSPDNKYKEPLIVAAQPERVAPAAKVAWHSDLTAKASAQSNVESNDIFNKHFVGTLNNQVAATTAASDELIQNTPAGESIKAVLDTELKGLEELLVEYIENFFNRGQYKPLPSLVIELQKNHTLPTTMATTTAAKHEDPTNFVRNVRHIVKSTNSSMNDDSLQQYLPRALQTGRLLFFTGLKKILWPIFVGLQILKSLLFAMFLPSLIGSFGKLLGKGIASASIRPMEAPQDLDFRDNSFNFDEENNKFIINDDGGNKDGAGAAADAAAYAYNQPEASQTHYTYNAANINNQALSRYGINEKQLYKMPDSYMSALQSIGSASFKNSGSFSAGSSQQGVGAGAGLAGALLTPARVKPMAAANMNNFQTFQKVPASSLLLSNYDPFYSPLLSRLDSVFAQLKLNSENEECREKLICLMYANPAKYAPYSNLVSAQLSRELNELRKPTSDNPDILRFFKYMRAAKDGQDGVECEESFDKCKEFKDFENPAMVSTYHDINKLVQARKLT